MTARALLTMDMTHEALALLDRLKSLYRVLNVTSRRAAVAAKIASQRGNDY